MLNDKLYNTLKWIVMIALPAIAVFIKSVGVEIGIQDPDTVVVVLNGVTALLGSLIGVSTLQYNKDKSAK